ncbi:hypothetical protein A6E19_17775 [Pseudomonas putida]|nr:hypothetical protein A6E20_16920 [Pseudomonas putida]OCT25991.1 hypothetical protein A6E23_10400 [Pseudomonas putida]OCT30348.1 hypothetical protein A6E24_03180 [Pseudomonas putida]OCT36866.1 hypothetical protein A6E19_17775 [Pseudomonas putida]
MHDFVSCGDLVIVDSSALRVVLLERSLSNAYRRFRGGRGILQTNRRCINRFWSETKLKLQVTL